MTTRLLLTTSIRRRIPTFPLKPTLRSLSSSSSSSSSPPPPSTPPPPPTDTNTNTHTHFGFKQVPTHEKEDLVKGVFNSVASKYDVMNDLMSGGLHRLWKDDFVKMAGVPPIVRANAGGKGLKFLDVAGGTGDIAFRLMQRAIESHPHSPPSITICDINAEMLKVGQERAKTIFSSSSSSSSRSPLSFPPSTTTTTTTTTHTHTHRHTPIQEALTWVEGNAEHLPFDDNTFDLYTIAFGLRNVTHRQNALKDAYRVLKKGGRFLCLEFSHVSLPIAKEVYDLYSFEVIPRMGAAVTGDAGSYRYLVESIRQFPKQTDLVHELEDAGFKSVTYTNYTLGAVAVHSGFKWA